MQLIILLVSSFLIIFLGGYSFFKNRKDIVNAIFFLFTISIAGWIISIFFILHVSQALIVGELPFVFASFIFSFLLLFSLCLDDFCEKKLEFKRAFFLFAALLPSIILSIFAFTGSIVDSVKVEDGFITNTFGSLYYVFTAHIVLYAALVFTVLIYKYFKSFGIRRTRIKYVFLGIILFIVPATMTNLILPTFFNVWSLNIIGPSFSLFMVVFMTYAIVRYHLMDIWIIVKKGAVFTVLLSIITFVYVFLGSFLGEYLVTPLNYFIPSVFITFGFIPLKNLVESATDKFFFRKQYKLAETISKIDNSLYSSISSIDEALSEMNKVIIESLRVEGAAIVTLSKKKGLSSKKIIGSIGKSDYDLGYDNAVINYLESHQNEIIDKNEILTGGGKIENNKLKKKLVDVLEKINFELAVPIVFKDDLVGAYFIGEKLSKDSFTRDDINLLFHVARNMGSIINNAGLVEELKNIDKVKSEFISVLSHQLRTPLTTARWNMEMLLEEKEIKEIQLGQIQEAYQSVLFIGKQLDDLIIALDIEEGKIELGKRKVDLNEVIRDVIENDHLIAKNNRLKIDLAGSLPNVEVDNNRIRNVFDIILRNAIMYSQENGNVLVRSFKKAVGGKKFIIVEISDEGIGIDKGNEERIFSKFFRSHRARSVSPNGLGLGLYIAKKIVEAHGGNMWFESKSKGKGVSFYFSIPI